MAECIAFFTEQFGSFFSWLNSVFLVPGVSLLAFFGAMFVISLLLGAFVLRG